MSFLEKFEKLAYDYAHEIKQYHDHYKGMSGRPDPNMKSYAGYGAGFGTGFGALLGGLQAIKDKSVLPLFVGALGGAATGGLLGVFGAILEKRGIEEAKKIMAMPLEERKAYLAYLAREDEISEQEFREWSKERKEDRKHDELLSALGSRK